MEFSVVICTWKRHEEINKAISYYQLFSDDIVVWDNGNVSDYIENKQELLVIKPSLNLGSCAKFKATAFTRNNYVLISDDDVIPEEGFAEDLCFTLSSFDTPYLNLLAIFGRRFPEGGGYNHDENQRFRARDIKELTPVDFLGQLYFGHRNFFTVDIQNTKSVYDDVMLIHLQNVVHKDLKRWVLPTKHYHYSSDMIGKHELCNQPEFYDKRDKLSKAIYARDIDVMNRVLHGGDV